MHLGPGKSGKLLLSLYIILHIFPTSSVISSAFNFWIDPEYNNINKAQQANQHKETARVVYLQVFIVILL